MLQTNEKNKECIDIFYKASLYLDIILTKQGMMINGRFNFIRYLWENVAVGT